MRITLVIYSLGAGGAERVMSVMANYWAEHGQSVTLLTLDSASEPPFFDLHPAVVRRPLGITGASPNPIAALAGNLRRLAHLRRAVAASRPDVVISFMDHTNILTLLAVAGMRLPAIVAVHNDPHQSRLGMPWAWLREQLYPHASAVVTLSETALGYFSARVRRRGLVIPNPVVLPAGMALGRAGAGERAERRLIAMGRLVHLKGFDLLLRAFAQAAPRYPDWSLDIWGDGPLRGELEALRDQLGLVDRVRLPGTTRRPSEPMQQADLFVLSSRHEGFPIALCEAMACGLPVVAFDCPSGPREIVRDGVDGVLVPPEDIDALSTALCGLMGDLEARRRIGQRAPEVLERFGIDRVMAIWEQLFQELSPYHRHLANRAHLE
ncbi:MAG: glycosyltransferase family 4 protein [Kouleothrix sp.]|nr:glycosyltransferase family 4 protein [Kouleothrix sp.]